MLSISEMEPTPIKEKLTRSRNLCLKLKNSVFISKLYEILDVNDKIFHRHNQWMQDPKNDPIISWDAEGTRILIKDTKKLITDILPNFERCITLINFFRRVLLILFSLWLTQKKSLKNADFLKLMRKLQTQAMYLSIYITAEIKGQSLILPLRSEAKSRLSKKKKPERKSTKQIKQ